MEMAHETFRENRVVVQSGVYAVHAGKHDHPVFLP